MKYCDDIVKGIKCIISVYLLEYFFSDSGNNFNIENKSPNIFLISQGIYFNCTKFSQAKVIKLLHKHSQNNSSLTHYNQPMSSTKPFF